MRKEIDENEEMQAVRRATRRAVARWRPTAAQRGAHKGSQRSFAVAPVAAAKEPGLRVREVPKQD